MRSLYALLVLFFAAAPALAQRVPVTGQCDLLERADVTSTRLGGLFPGNTVERLGTEGAWVRVARNGLTGYVMAACLEAPPAPAESRAEREATGSTGESVDAELTPYAIVYDEATATGSARTIDAGGRVTVTGQTGDRYRIVYEGRTYYTTRWNVRGNATALARVPSVRASSPSRSSGSASGSRATSSGGGRGSAPAGVTLHRGPRGGCYYLSASGGSVYVDRSECDAAGVTRVTSPARSITRRGAQAGYYTGPRGGCYTYSASGRKRYVAHSYCRR